MSFFKKLGKIVAWVIAITLMYILGRFMLDAIHQRYEGGGNLVGIIVVALAALVPLALTIPFVVYTFFQLAIIGRSVNVANGKPGRFLKVPILISFFSPFIVYPCFAFSLFFTYNLGVHDSPVVLLTLLWVCSTLLAGCIFYGLMGMRYIRIVFSLAGMLFATVTLFPMIQIMHELALAKSANGVVIAYGTPFNPKELKEYKFPNFILKPDIQYRQFILFLKDKGEVRNLHELCVHNDEFRSDCSDPTSGFGYKEEEVNDTPIDGKFYWRRHIPPPLMLS